MMGPRESAVADRVRPFGLAEHCSGLRPRPSCHWSAAVSAVSVAAAAALLAPEPAFRESSLGQFPGNKAETVGDMPPAPAA